MKKREKNSSPIKARKSPEDKPKNSKTPGAKAPKSKTSKSKPLKSKTPKNKSRKSKTPNSNPSSSKTPKIQDPVPQKKPITPDPCIVGIGASAGGMEAFQILFKNIRNASNIAFILAPHLDPDHISILPELIRKVTDLEVITADDGMKVVPGRIYVAPPNHELRLFHGVFQLLKPITKRITLHPINTFFESLAQDQGQKAIAVILSGMGTDGTTGIKEIKNRLGMTIAQDPKTAKYDSMPVSAINSGLVDMILPPEEIPVKIAEYCQHFGLRDQEYPEDSDKSIPDPIQKIFILLRAQTGHDFSMYKPNTIYRRIDRRLHLHHIDRLEEYYLYLRKTPDEVTALFNDLLIRVTQFFRDPDAFNALKEKFLIPYLRTCSIGYDFRVWVPGCASGEEAYSIAILLDEYRRETGIDIKIHIFSTDLDLDAIDIARKGFFSSNISENLSKERLERYFTEKETGYQISKEIREMLIFAEQSIIRDPPFTKLDLLCCRNLLIYLNSTRQQMLLPMFHYSLREGGALFLGVSETVGKNLDLFSVLDKKWKIFTKKGNMNTTYSMVTFPSRTRKEEILVEGPKDKPKLQLPLIVDKMLLNSYAPPSVIVDTNDDVLYIHGSTGDYLELPRGNARLNINDMARSGIEFDLRKAIREVRTKHVEVVKDGVTHLIGDLEVDCTITVKPLNSPAFPPNLLLVVFEETALPSKKKATSKSGKRSPTNRALERELQITKENLQSVIEEHQTSNEELKSSNEELQSTNEELQSTNEELETSKEEQQSLNEELVTLNNELQSRIDELTGANDDMRNLLESLEVPTLFLDTDLNIRRFTVHTQRVINLIETDIGRPIEHIVHKLEYDGLIEDAKKVIKNLISINNEVQTKDGSWYLMRILPYRTIHDQIAGVVITFMDINDQKLATQRAQGLSESVEIFNDYIDNLIDMLWEPLLIVDNELKVHSANKRFYDVFKVVQRNTEGEYIYSLGNGQWDIPELRRLLETIIPKDRSIDEYEVVHDFPVIGKRKILLNARKVDKGKKEKDLILIAFEDITDR